MIVFKCNCTSSNNKSSPIQNQLLFVTGLRTRDNTLSQGCQTGGPRSNFLWPTMLWNTMKTNENKRVNKSNYIAILYIITLNSLNYIMCFNYPIRIPESSLQNIILRKFVNVMWPALILPVALNGPCFNWVWHTCSKWSLMHSNMSIFQISILDHLLPLESSQHTWRGISTSFLLRMHMWYTRAVLSKASNWQESFTGQC
jgi:hypothetical protein